MARYTTVSDNWQVGRDSGYVMHKHQNKMYVRPTKAILDHPLTDEVVLEYDYLAAKRALDKKVELPVHIVQSSKLHKRASIDVILLAEQEISLMLADELKSNRKARSELLGALRTFVDEIDAKYRYRSKKGRMSG